MYSDYTSGKFFNVEEDTQKRGALDSIQTKPTTFAKLISKTRFNTNSYFYCGLDTTGRILTGQTFYKRCSHNTKKTEKTVDNRSFVLEDT